MAQVRIISGNEQYVKLSLTDDAKTFFRANKEKSIVHRKSEFHHFLFAENFYEVQNSVFNVEIIKISIKINHVIDGKSCI